MIIKKTLSVILVLATLLSLVACGSAEPTVATTAETTAETTAVTEMTETTVETTAETTTETTAETTTVTTTAETTTETTTETTAETTTEAATEATTAQAVWIDTTQTPSTEARPDHPYLGWEDESKPYYLKVNTLCNTVTVYAKDSQGYHTVPIKAMVCSTGFDTPQNTIYTLRGKGKWEWLSLFGNVYGRFATQISGNILFHSVPYLRWEDKASLKYAEYDKLGTSCSMGCIRLVLSDAIWIYVNKSSIAGVEFYSDSDPGPLGKPSAQLISSNEVCRNWDPTDTDPANPWLSWKEPAETTTETTTETTAETTTETTAETTTETTAETTAGTTTETTTETTAETTAEAGMTETTVETTAETTVETATETTSETTNENTTETASEQSTDLTEPPPAE